MVSSSASNWTVRGVTFLVWAAAAASAAYWTLQLTNPSVPGVVAPVPLRQGGTGDPMAIARVLGHSPTATPGTAGPAAPTSSRFTLVGVVAGRSQQGAALIAVDGRPARPYRVGSRVDEGLVLQSVQGRRAVLAASTDGPPVVTLELPPLQR